MKLLICTPTRGELRPEYVEGLLDVVPSAGARANIEIVGWQRWHEDVVRVRSRMLRVARELGADVVHFIDADNVQNAACFGGMLRAVWEGGKPIVCAPYPRRDVIDFPAIVDGARGRGDAPPEADAYVYSLQPLPGGFRALDAHACTPIAWAPLGCTMVRVDAVARMQDAYAARDKQRVDLEAARACEDGAFALEYLRDAVDELAAWRAGHMGLVVSDRYEGEEHETVELFQLLARVDDVPPAPGVEIAQRVRLMSEDKSFCYRARDMGLEVSLYLGDGAPVAHVGEHVYHGHLASFGL